MSLTYNIMLKKLIYIIFDRVCVGLETYLGGKDATGRKLRNC